MAQQLPKIVQSASGKSYDSSSPQGKMIVNSPNYKNPFDKQSTSLATMAPADTGLAAAGAGNLTPQMNPMESVMAVFSEMADSLASIKESAIELVMVGQADTRGDALNSANVVQDLPPEDDERDIEKVSKFDKIKGKLPDLKTMGITALIAGILLFSEKLKEPLARLLEFFKNIFDRFTVIFGGDSTLSERIFAFFGIFTDIGSFLWDTFNGLTESIANLFGLSFDPYDGLGSWIVGKLGEGFQFIKDWFVATAPAWLVDDISNIKDWIISKVTNVFSGITDFFSSAKEAYTVGGFTGLWEWTKDKLLTAFEPIVTFFTGAVDAYKVDGASGVWEYVKTKIALAFEPIMTFFTGATEAWTVGGASGVWDYVKTKISDAFAPIVNFFKSESKDGGMFDFDGNPTILSWIVDKLKLPFKFLTDLFSFPETPEEGLFSFEFGGIVVGKFIDFLQLPLNLAINFIKGIFGWGDPEEPFKLSTFISGIFTSVKTWFLGLFSWGDDDEKESFSLGTFISNKFTAVKDWFVGLFTWIADAEDSFSLTTFIVDKFVAVKDWLVSKFTFDFPDLGLGDKLMSIGDMIMNFVGGLLPNPNKWLGKAIYKIPGTGGLKAAAEMFQAGGSIEGGVMTMPATNPTQELKDATSQLDTATGDVVVIDNTNNSTNNTTSDTYNQQELSSDDKESSGSWWSRVDLTPWN
jgi:hypothetical protein